MKDKSASPASEPDPHPLRVQNGDGEAFKDSMTGIPTDMTQICARYKRL